MNKEKIKEVGLSQFVKRAMVRYGLSVNEDRSLPEMIDGLKPVQRRVLWATYKMNLSKPVKTARIVGDCMGYYHPHGDKSVSDAIETMVNQPMPTMHGEGNWGSIVGDSAAAARYTNAKLSKYGETFFDSYYMPVVDFVPNYDGSEKEPVVLPTMLPNLLLNGVSGIGVGVTSDIPAYTIGSVISLLETMLTSGEECSAKLCMTHLRFKTKSNAVVHIKEHKKELFNFYKTGIGAIKFSPKLTVENGLIKITGVAPFKGVDNYVSKIMEIGEWSKVSAFNDKTRQWDLCYYVKPTKGTKIEELQEAIEKHLSSVKHFKINVTSRKLSMDTGWPEVSVSFKKSSVPELINMWMAYRVNLEIKATKYQLGVLQKAIRKNEVLRLAVKFRDFIISLIKNEKLTEDELKTELMQKLKVDQAEAAMLYDLKWRQLRSLEDAALVNALKKQRLEEIAFNKRIKNPNAAILASLQKIKGDINERESTGNKTGTHKRPATSKANSK
jgi:DNA gyrase subunit A